jgi:hypothetical protein
MELFNKSNVVHMLHHNVVTVKFIKLNGEERVMKCTLLPEYLPATVSVEGRTLVNEDDGRNNVAVWDIDAAGWRSFRVDSVKTISVG